MTTHKPATPLPWRTLVGRFNQKIVAGKRDKQVALIGRIEKEYERDFDYIAHAANAYPRLVVIARDCLRALDGIGADTSEQDNARALLAELGE